MFNQFKPKDIIAFMVITGFTILRLKKVDGGFDAPLALILGYYFVKRESGLDNGK
jgi:hypothetical protein